MKSVKEGLQIAVMARYGEQEVVLLLIRLTIPMFQSNVITFISSTVLFYVVSYNKLKKWAFKIILVACVALSGPQR